MEKEPDISTKNPLSHNATPLPKEQPPLLSLISHFLLLWTLKITVSLYLKLLRTIFPSINVIPTLTKSYPCRPTLQVRIFMPTDSPSSFPPTPLPLYLNIHGGAFALCDPRIDNAFCASWSTRTNAIVANLEYRKAPTHQFPVPVLDIAMLAQSVIDDSTLPIDKSRIVIGGFSCGGNLALAATQVPGLRGRVKAAVCFFPVLDWSLLPRSKWARRLWREVWFEPVYVASDAIEWGYIPTGVERRKSLLSPCFADKEHLPEWVCLVGAQHDLLCREARDMAFGLAGKTVDDKEGQWGWEMGKYKWLLVRGVRHGFTDTFWPDAWWDARARRKICDDTYADVQSWLKEKVLV